MAEGHTRLEVFFAADQQAILVVELVYPVDDYLPLVVQAFALLVGRVD